jgi:hypothetical protein
VTNPTRPSIPYPSVDDLDFAPQLLVVLLADAALLAVDRAFDCAHPILAATNRPTFPRPPLIATERLAARVLDLSAELAALLRDYADAVRVEVEDVIGDPPDPF